MSSVTLDALLADFEAARQAVVDDLNLTNESMSKTAIGLRALMARDVLRRNADATAAPWSKMLNPKTEPSFYKLRWAARTYVIARDYGVDAAILYKLSDGVINPRAAN